MTQYKQTPTVPHECILKQGQNYVCTACGTTTPIPQSQSLLSDEEIARAHERISAYLSRMKKDVRRGQDCIHAYDSSPEGGIELLTADVQCLLDATFKVRQQDEEMTRDAERLDFVLHEQAFLYRDVKNKLGVQLWSQDEDEDYFTLSGDESKWFKTSREAIDAAIAIAKQKGEHQ